jgi:cytoskeletal protein CcmA (bactofilin family)
MTGTAASLITEGTKIHGGVSGDCELQVEGIIEGDVAVTLLSVGGSGKIEGSTKAEAVEVRGHVIGSIIAKKVMLLAGCRVEGDILHEQLVVEAGAIFEGRSLRDQPSAPALVFRGKSQAIG